MNRTLKIFFLLLFVSSVSFVYAQQEGKEVEKDDNLGGKGSLTEEKVNQGGKLDINKGLTAKDAPAGPSATKMDAHDMKDGSMEGAVDKPGKATWLQKLLGIKPKAQKKEDDPN